MTERPIILTAEEVRAVLAGDSMIGHEAEIANLRAQQRQCAEELATGHCDRRGLCQAIEDLFAEELILEREPDKMK